AEWRWQDKDFGIVLDFSSRDIMDLYPPVVCRITAMRRTLYIAAIVVACTCVGRAFALSFSLTYVDDANGTFASRGWLDPNSLFQCDLRAAANLCGDSSASDM